jgi:hypothetical protein
VTFEPSDYFDSDFPEPEHQTDPRLLVAAFIGTLFLVVFCLGMGGLAFNTGRLAALRGDGTPPAALAASPTTTPLVVAAPNTPRPSPSATSSSTPSSTPTPTITPGPTAVVAVATETVAPECEQGYLFAAGRVFEIEILALPQDGSVRLPQGSADAAYYVEGSALAGVRPHAFLLSDTPENLALLGGGQAGGPVSILWRGCILEESTLLGVERRLAADPLAVPAGGNGVLLFIQEGSVGAQPPRATAPSSPQSEQATAIPFEATATSLPLAQASPTSSGPTSPTTTAPAIAPAPTSTFVPPPPGRGEIEAEITFLGKQVAASTITVTISIYNYGSNAYTIYMADANLVSPNQEAILPLIANPSLPYQIGSRGTQSFSFTFPNPGGRGIVFQIFEVVEFDLDDF